MSEVKALADLWNEPLHMCYKKRRICAFMGKETCALPKCAYYKRERRKYESNRSRPR